MPSLRSPQKKKRQVRLPEISSVNGASGANGATNGHAYPPKKNWVGTAREISELFQRTAAEREQKRVRPLAEIQQLKDAGLVNLIIPKRFGGEGGSFLESVQVVRELSRGDASIGGLLGFHYYTYSVPRFFDFKGEGEAILRRSAKNRWIWGNITQPLEKNFRIEALPGGKFRLNGVKKWNTGPSLADVTTVVGPRSDKKELLFAVIPTDRKGLKYHDDWDSLGIRLAETVTIGFENVDVLPEEVIPSTHAEPQVGFAPFYGPYANLLYGAVFAGAALGGLESVRDYTRTKTKLHPLSRVETPTKDPYILLEYGRSFLKLQAAAALLDEVAREFDDIWSRRLTITPAEQGRFGVRAAAARAYAAEVALEISPRLYEVTGGSAVKNSYGFDRTWRDVRTLVQHDPMVYAVRGVGDFFLNGALRENPVFVR